MATPTMKFCTKCKNIMEYKEDKENKVLLCVCRTCDHKEAADNNCVYTNVILEPVEVIDPNFAKDPTLPRNKSITCPQCNNKGALYFRAKPRDGEVIPLNYICCEPNCQHKWRV